MLRIILLVCDNQGQKRNGFSCARRHLQDAVSTCIEGLLDSAHIFILLGIDPWIGKQHREVTA